MQIKNLQELLHPVFFHYRIKMICAVRADKTPCRIFLPHPYSALYYKTSVEIFFPDLLRAVFFFIHNYIIIKYLIRIYKNYQFSFFYGKIFFLILLNNKTMQFCLKQEIFIFCFRAGINLSRHKNIKNQKNLNP